MNSSLFSGFSSSFPSFSFLFSSALDWSDSELKASLKALDINCWCLSSLKSSFCSVAGFLFQGLRISLAVFLYMFELERVFLNFLFFQTSLWLPFYFYFLFFLSFLFSIFLLFQLLTIVWLISILNHDWICESNNFCLVCLVSLRSQSLPLNNLGLDFLFLCFNDFFK